MLDQSMGNISPPQASDDTTGGNFGAPGTPGRGAPRGYPLVGAGRGMSGSVGSNTP